MGSNPSSPPLLDTITAGSGSETYGVAVRGDYAYVARGDYGLVIFDISNPVDLKYAGGMPCIGTMHLSTDGTLIYAAAMTYSTGDAWLYVVL